MRDIINGKMYNTDTAELVATYYNICTSSNVEFFREELYRKKNGEWFLHGEGNAMSAYATVQGNNSGWGEKIIPYTDSEARKWAETYADVDTYIKYFGEPEK